MFFPQDLDNSKFSVSNYKKLPKNTELSLQNNNSEYVTLFTDPEDISINTGVETFVNSLSPSSLIYSIPNVNNYEPHAKTTEDYIMQAYIGSFTIVGLFIFFRLLQKSS